MKTKITLIAASAFLWLSSARAQVPCANDLNGFVNYKNVGTTGAYLLQNGFEEKASQTYNYSGPGRITSVRVSGSYPGIGFFAGVALKIGVYNVDGSGKPTTSIASANRIWWSFPDNVNGYFDVTFPGGVTVNNRFAISVEIENSFPNGNSFNLKYTGNGEGGAQDLASLSGTSTGFNWASAKNSFSKDGDFYIVPNMANVNAPSFTTNSSCYDIGNVVYFTNTTQMTKDSMFNKISLTNYAGANKLYTWNFGDGSATSNLLNPTHTYTAGGVYTTTLATMIEGWNSNCIKTFTNSVSVGLNVNATSITNVTCNGGNNGSFIAQGLNGAPTYSFNINGQPWQTSSSFNGLFAGSYTLNIKDKKGCTNSTVFSINQPSGILFSSIIPTNANCGSPTGVISSTATGGVAPLTYKLDGGSYQSNGIFSNLLSGTHTLTAKDANACTTTTMVIVNSLTGPSMNMPNTTNVSCFGGNDGSIFLSSTGGTGLIQYSINGGLSYQTNGLFINVAAGTYNCVVKDNAGCTNYAFVYIAQGPALNLTASTSPAYCNGSSNGQINVASTGGTGIHNYSIDGINYQSGTNFSGLSAGLYNVYVKDITSCIKTQTVIIEQPLPIITSVTTTPATCNGLSNGAITIVANGGNGNYFYSIDGINYQGVGTFNNLPAGTYTISGFDNKNCSFSTTANIIQPAAITTTVNTTNATCTFTNGSIMVIASGGSGSGFQYSIDGINYFVSGAFSSLSAGTHYVISKDGSGCTTVSSGVITSAGGPTITLSNSQNVSCNGGHDGSITINTVAGGTGVLQYSKDGVTFQTSNVLTNLTAGVYVVQVKDANGCIGTVTKTITQPSAFLIATTTTSITCYGDNSGSALISASGGAGFLAYSINGGTTYQSGTLFNGLGSGTYNVIVKDAANCTSTSSFIINQSPPIIVTVGILNVTCYGANNGGLNVSAVGGKSPYLYSLDGITYTSVSTFTNLAGNTNYYVFVKDANNCIVSTPRYIIQPSILTINPIISNVTCAGGNNGVINLNVFGGVSPYAYIWSNGELSSSNVNLTAGTYSVVIRDYNRCTTTDTYSVSQPLLPLIVNGVLTPASSNSTNDGAIDITVNGGVAPYLYNWSNGSTTEDLNGVIPGAYMVTINDAQGCTTSITFNVSNITGINNIQINSNEIKIYPNPANDFAMIDAQGYKIEKIELINLLGRKLLETEVKNTFTRINTSDLLNGTYFVKIYLSNNTSVTKKLSINK